MVKKLLTPAAEYLHKLYWYDPKTGALWSRRRRRGHPIRKANNKGYIQIEIDGVAYCAHKIIFKMMTGRDPLFDVDHWDRNPSNNRWNNLREANNSQNQGNRKPRGKIKGVTYRASTGRWLASIQVDKKKMYLGSFATAAEAHAAYCTAADKHFCAFSRHG
jgi:HNH endonuclease/AP2 domain